MNIIIHLPKSAGHYAIFTIADRFSKEVTIILYLTSSTALDLAKFIYDHNVYKCDIVKFDIIV